MCARETLDNDDVVLRPRNHNILWKVMVYSEAAAALKSVGGRGWGSMIHSINLIPILCRTEFWDRQHTQGVTLEAVHTQPATWHTK